MNRDARPHGSPTIGRRSFLATAGAAIAAAPLGLSCSTPALRSGDPVRPAGPGRSRKPKVSVVFIRPEKPVVVSWPGGNCDTDAQQTLFAGTLREAAGNLDVELQVREKPMIEAAEVGAWIEGLRAAPPDGLIVCAMELFGGWDQVSRILAGRGTVPSIVYSNLSGFTGNFQGVGTVPGTYLAATQDVGWLCAGLRMLAAIARLRATRILLLAGDTAQDVPAEGLGATFHVVPRSRFEAEYEKVGETEEARAIAEAYGRDARKVVEPDRADLAAAARNYLVCRRLLEAEGCDALSIDCLGWKNPVCIAFSKLLDEGCPAGCEADRHAVLGQVISTLVLGRPGFIQDPSPNTVNNTLIGSHCTSPTRLEGYESDYRAPYMIRDYHTRTGAAIQVLWPEGKDVTVIDLGAPDRLALGTGRVRSNIPQPPSGCCRTAVEIEIDGVTDSRDRVDSRSAKGFHQVFILGNHGRALKAWCQLAGIAVEPLCG
jgi:hypothetical protein